MKNYNCIGELAASFRYQKTLTITMEEKDITTTELQSICDKVGEGLLDSSLQTDLTITEKHYFALKTLLSAIRKQMNIPEWLPVLSSKEYSPKQNVFNAIQQLLHSKGIPAKPFVINFLKKVFGEEANFGDL